MLCFTMIYLIRYSISLTFNFMIMICKDTIFAFVLNYLVEICGKTDL